MVEGLPLVIRDELKLDPGCFFHRSDYTNILEGTWNPATREYKNKGMMNQEQYLQELDEFFSVNRIFLPEMIVLDSAENKETQAKAIALASGTDDVSVLSQLTDKTLRAATTTMTSGGASHDDSSIESGQTSRSKTQAAVKEALKEVSLEHNRAMEEQRVKFQRELEELRRSMERNSTQNRANTTDITQSLGVIVTQHVVAGAASEDRGLEIEGNDSPPQEALMEIDSSDDEMAMIRDSQIGGMTGVLDKASKSPQPKRPKRSTSRTLRSRGGSKSHPGPNDE
eukprot:CAMPEP_0176493588 /NCGR_PEP_ID=MMETSP0200_2-20121128/9627_1 /TAXON_ID=947934 /ORGANISM="Chaetoceros sp., Strain GSL56" /LENGTH=282 /DNA_ID=CAMNT_0017891257 /DNA_START=202 /DNA_END=1050 /DNA_ORIENTATION=-